MSVVRVVVVGLALATVTALVGAGIRLDQVHDYGWEWTLVPSAAPPKVEYDGRDYDRGGERDSVPDGAVASGETMGGGTIYAFADPGTQTIIYVADGEDVWTYGLLGGP